MGILRAGAAYALAAIALLLVAAILVWSGEFAAFEWANHDAANCLYIGQRIVAGDLLYVDWYYFVTPPIVVLSTAACFVAELSGLSPPTVLHLFLILTGILGIVVIRGSFPKGAYAPALGTLAYVGILASAGFSSGDFAQREHFFALLFVPYLLWRLSLRAPSGFVYVLLVCLGFAAMNKPHFVLGVVAAEAFFLRRDPLRRRVWVSLVSGALLPVLLLALHSTRALEGLFTRALPYHLSGNYTSYTSASIERYLSTTPNQVLTLLGFGVLVCAVVGAFRRAVRPRAAVAVIVVALVFYLSILHQGKFYPYHTIPFVALACVLGATLAAQLLSTLQPGRMTLVLSTILAMLPIGLIGFGIGALLVTVRSVPSKDFEPLIPLLEREELVMLMTPSVEHDIFTYALTHDVEIMRPWTSNFTFAGLLAADDPIRREQAVREYFEPLAARIADERPGLVLFSPEQQSMPGKSMHAVIVEEYGLFPLPGYVLSKRLPSGWIVYDREEEDDRNG